MNATLATNAETATAELPQTPPQGDHLVLLSLRADRRTYPVRGQLLWLGLEWVPSERVWLGVLPRATADRLVRELGLQEAGRVEVAPPPPEPEVECPKCGRRLAAEELEGHVGRVHAGAPAMETKRYEYPGWMGTDPDLKIKEGRERESLAHELQAEREREGVV